MTPSGPLGNTSKAVVNKPALIRKSSNKLGFGAIQTHASQAQEGALNRQEAEENVNQSASGSFRVMLDPRLAPPPDPAGVITW